MLAAVIPFPTPDRTPPVTNMYFCFPCLFPWVFESSMGFHYNNTSLSYAMDGVLCFSATLGIGYVATFTTFWCVFGFVAAARKRTASSP